MIYREICRARARIELAAALHKALANSGKTQEEMVEFTNRGSAERLLIGVETDLELRNLADYFTELGAQLHIFATSAAPVERPE